METSSPQNCNDTLIKLFDEIINSTSLVNMTRDGKISNLTYLCYKGYESDVNEKFSKPLVWVGVYVAAASFFCILGMVADLLLGIRNKCYQIPSKFSSVNVTSMMLIAIATKLTVDLSGSMPGNLDQAAKIGSIAFMSTMMAISNPSLASMNDKTLFTNMLGLAIFVITIAVNLLIQIGTGVITNKGPRHLLDDKDNLNVVKIYYSFMFVRVASVYIGIMLLLLLISIASAIIIPSIKKVLEFKYQVRRKALNDRNQHTRISTVEELTQNVTRYWIMAKSGSPQFVMASNLISYTSLTLCIIGMGLYAKVLSTLLKQAALHENYESDYKWSIPVILITQFIGNVIGTLIVFIRCIRSMKFKEVSWESTDMFNLRKDKYWTEKLSDWKGSHINCLASYPWLRTIVHFVRNHVLNLFIGLQKAFLVSICQFLGFWCISCLQLIIIISDALKSTTPPVVSRNDDINRDLRNYILQLDDEVQPSQKVVENMSMSMNRLIQRAKKKQSNNLLKLLGKSNGFEGLVSFDDIGQTFGFSPLPPSVMLINSWSVPVITLTCIAIAVPGVSKYQVDSLIKSIDNALLYTDRVEESFNCSHDYVNIRKTTALWYEVKDKRMWLKNPIKTLDQRGRLPKETLTWFAEKAEAILRDHLTNTFEEHMIKFPNKLIAAHSMHRISRSILSSNQDEIATKELFFELLTSMIADILVACFSNIPQVIMMKCHANEIEKREANVEAAAKLLGRSTEIIRKLEACKLPSMDPEKMASIHEWRLHLKQSSSSKLPPSIKI